MRASACADGSARWRRPRGCATIACAAVLLALAAQPARVEAQPTRGRKLINLQTQTTKYFHQPLVNCQNYTVTTYADPAGVAPACCALSAMECATRCDSVPGCLAFKYAWYMNAQPTARDTPNPAPLGQQWTWCMLLSWFEISSCSAELRWDPSANFTQVRPQDIWDTYYRQATNSTPQAGSWNLFYDAWAAATAPNVTANATDAAAAYKLPVVVGLSVGLGAPLALAFAALALLLLLVLRRRLPGVAAGRSREWQPDPSRKHDVFLSYRRKELAVADQVHDKLTLAGLRVFYDRGGAMAGRPFEQELYAAIRDSPVFASVITLNDVQRWAEHDATAVDFTLAEIVIALHFARTGRVRLIFPLLVGEPVGTASKSERDYLFSNAQFKTARMALPAVVPAATIAQVVAIFNAAAGNEVLSPELATATVRDLILGPSASGGMHANAPAGASEGPSAAAGPSRQDELVAISVQHGGSAARLRGILEMDAVFLYGPDEQAGLVLRYRYAGSIMAALTDDAARGISGKSRAAAEAASSPVDVSLAV